jgi:ABC-type multidrug transport system fused ATPase/permease subunit
MRFYDPLLGAVKFNDQSIKDFNLTGIRDAIGYVGQEPVLIGKTIREALIAEKKTDAEIIRALKAA